VQWLFLLEQIKSQLEALAIEPKRHGL